MLQAEPAILLPFAVFYGGCFPACAVSPSALGLYSHWSLSLQCSCPMTLWQVHCHPNVSCERSLSPMSYPHTWIDPEEHLVMSLPPRGLFCLESEVPLPREGTCPLCLICGSHSQQGAGLGPAGFETWGPEMEAALVDPRCVSGAVLGTSLQGSWGPLGTRQSLWASPFPREEMRLPGCPGPGSHQALPPWSLSPGPA